MKLGVGKFGKRGIVESSENGLGPAIASPDEFLKDLAIGVIATLLFSLGLYICISGLVIAFLGLVL